MSFKVTDIGTNRKLIYDFLSKRYQGNYCALSLEFMNLLGIYTVGVARSVFRRLLLDIVIIGSKSLYWKHANLSLCCILNGLHAAGYNSTESEPMWMKFGKLSARCSGLAMADFGRDPRSSHSLRKAEIFFGFLSGK